MTDQPLLLNYPVQGSRCLLYPTQPAVCQMPCRWLVRLGRATQCSFTQLSWPHPACFLPAAFNILVPQGQDTLRSAAAAAAAAAASFLAAAAAATRALQWWCNQSVFVGCVEDVLQPTSHALSNTTSLGGTAAAAGRQHMRWQHRWSARGAERTAQCFCLRAHSKHSRVCSVLPMTAVRTSAIQRSKQTHAIMFHRATAWRPHVSSQHVSHSHAHDISHGVHENLAVTNLPRVGCSGNGLHHQVNLVPGNDSSRQRQ